MLPEEVSEAGAQVVEITGQLKLADDRTGHTKRIVLEDEHQAAHHVIVPPGMMADIVRPMWDDVVIVRGVAGSKGILLQTIKRAQEK